jgi:O-antigen ligase
MIYLLIFLYIFATLPAALLSSLGFVQAISNIKSGYLVMTPADLTTPVIMMIAVIKWKELQLFVLENPRLTRTFVLFTGWALLIALASGLNPAIEGKEYGIGLLRFLKFTATLLWCPVAAVTVSSYKDQKKLTAAVIVGVSIIAYLILWNADSAYREVERSDADGGALVVKSALPYGGNAASVFLAGAICFLVPVLRGNLIKQMLVISPLAIALLVTTGRAGYLGVLIGLTYLLLAWRNWRGLLALCLVCAVGFSLSTVESIGNAIGSVTGKGENDVLFLSSNGRLDVYQFFIEELALKKLFYGSGFGIWGTGSALPMYTMHNFFLQMWAELGLPGLTLFLYLLWSLYAGETGRKTATNEYTVGKRALIVTICTASMTETYLYGGLVLGLLAVSCGLAIAAERALGARQQLPLSNSGQWTHSKRKMPNPHLITGNLNFPSP